MRYIIAEQPDGTAFVLDTHTNTPVLVASGEHVYIAPVANAQWTADRMNKSSYVESEFARPGLESRLEPVSSLETRLESTASLENRLEPLKQASNRDHANAWRVGAYRAAVESAERNLRRALESLPDTVANIASRVRLETALTYLGSGRETAENENPYV